MEKKESLLSAAFCPSTDGRRATVCLSLLLLPFPPPPPPPPPFPFFLGKKPFFASILLPLSLPLPRNGGGGGGNSSSPLSASPSSSEVSMCAILSLRLPPFECFFPPLLSVNKGPPPPKKKRGLFHILLLLLLSLIYAMHAAKLTLLSLGGLGAFGPFLFLLTPFIEFILDFFLRQTVRSTIRIFFALRRCSNLTTEPPPPT